MKDVDTFCRLRDQVALGFKGFIKTSAKYRVKIFVSKHEVIWFGFVSAGRSVLRGWLPLLLLAPLAATGMLAVGTCLMWRHGKGNNAVL